MTHFSSESKLGVAELLAQVAPNAQINLRSAGSTSTQPQREGEPSLPVPRIQEASVVEGSVQKLMGLPSSRPGASQASTRSNSPHGSSSTAISSSTTPRQHSGALTMLQQRCTAASLDDLGIDSDSVPSASPNEAVSTLMLEDLVSVSSSKRTPQCTPTSFGTFMSTSPGPHRKQAISHFTGDASRRSPVATPSSHQTIRKSTADACSTPISCLTPGKTPCHSSVNCNSTMSKPCDSSVMCTRPAHGPAQTGKKPLIDASLRPAVGTVISTSPPSSSKISQLTPQPSQDASRRASNRRPFESMAHSSWNSQPIQDVATKAATSESASGTDVVAFWLREIVGPLSSGQELAEKLRAVAPEVYED